MKFLIVQATALYAILGVLAIFSPHLLTDQNPFGTAATISEPDHERKVPGSNNATYGPVPRSEQLFHVDFLSIAPSPWELYAILVHVSLTLTNLLCRDRYFFTLLRGYILESKVADTKNLNKLLTTATVKISLNCVLPDGRKLPPEAYEIPLRTLSLAPWAHVSIRVSKGK